VTEPRSYWTYLELDRLLDAQHPASAEGGRAPAHDELLFIVIHQAFELWFKQVLWELDAVIAALSADPVPERALGPAVHRLERIATIERLLVEQFTVLETMTPLDFLDFRDELIPASGFQSVQFRLIENRLGLAPQQRLRILGAPYTSRLAAEHVELLERSESEPTLLAVLDRWLARTPFLRWGDVDFWRVYGEAVTGVVEAERRVVADNPNLDEVSRRQHVDANEATVSTFEVLLDPERWEAERVAGRRTLSHSAFLAALMISLYRDEPALHLPWRLLTAVIDLDDGLTAFRQAHSRAVLRAIGGRIGTGGTSGHAYLEAATRKHRVFGDLTDLATYHLPRRVLPELPAELRARMGFRFDGEDAS
jgi:tryptophan 2,3-dioxygenase